MHVQLYDLNNKTAVENVPIPPFKLAVCGG